MDWWQHLTATAWRFLEHHGQLGAFLFLLVEEAGTPVPIPGDFLMVLAGAQAARGRLNLLEILAVMELATVLGACFLYWISARAGRRVVYRLGKHVGLTVQRLDRASEALTRHGARAVILGRLTPGLRMATPIVCGLFRFPFRVYLPAVALGAFLYIFLYTLLGYFFGPSILRFFEQIELPLGLIVSALLLAGITFWVARVGRRVMMPDPCTGLGERLRAGAASGLLATFTSALLANVLIHAAGLLTYHAPGVGLRRLLAMLVSGFGREGGATSLLLLLPTFLVIGMALGALYGGWLGRVPDARGPLRGVGFAMIPLAVALFVLMPMVGAGVGGGELGAGLIPALGEVIRHAAYGLVLGTIYPALARARKNRPSAGSRAETLPTPAAERSGPRDQPRLARQREYGASAGPARSLFSAQGRATPRPTVVKPLQPGK